MSTQQKQTPKSLGLVYVAREHRWVGVVATDQVPSSAITRNDAHGNPSQFWDIGTVANWWRVRRNPADGVVSVARVIFP